VAYLDTPLELCLERIRGRQEAAGKVREIKIDLVKDKIKAINATRAKMQAAGIATVLLRHDRAQEDIMNTLAEIGAV
jgi:thymidylate kinase